MNAYKSDFLLNPEIIYLNHGSFGACPRPVFEIYQLWQRKLENQPVEFLGRQAADLLADARKTLADYLSADAEEVVFFPNPTTAVNMVARNFTRARDTSDHFTNNPFQLNPGDEILATDHEYGALNRTWRYICKLTGAKYITAALPLPYEGDSSFTDRFWSFVNENTRLIFISHITSPTALELPVAEICGKARSAGILTLVDGAHAPGQIPIDLSNLGADIYAGACHKWLCAPKGSAFLYAEKNVGQYLDPLVVSWGYESSSPTSSQFIDYHEWQGTRDLAAFLSVPAAIQFQSEHGWEKVKSDCHKLAVEARQEINAYLEKTPLCSQDKFHQMFTVYLPEQIDPNWLKEQLYNRYRIEAPAFEWGGNNFLRISVQAYNDEYDINQLLQALKELLPKK